MRTATSRRIARMLTPLRCVVPPSYHSPGTSMQLRMAATGHASPRRKASWPKIMQVETPAAAMADGLSAASLEAILGGGGDADAQLAGVAAFHPFSGRLLRPGGAKERELKQLGFEVDPANAMRLRLARLPDASCKAYQRLTRLARGRKGSWHRDFAVILASCPRRDVPDAATNAVSNGPSSDGSDGSLLQHINTKIQALYEQRSLVNVVPKLVAIVDTTVERLALSTDQQDALDKALRGCCMYIGGFAGTGKTMLMKVIHHRLTQRGLRVALTATTGVAAVHLGGCTFHHAVGIPTVTSAKQQWDTFALRSIDVLILDEVSLCDAALIQAFDETARFVRMNDKPFGGLQVIFCGDFLQLCVRANQGERPCFEHPLFANLTHVRLTTSLRHAAADAGFFKLLCNVRVANVDQEDRDWLLQLGSRTLSPEAASAAIYMFPKRASATALNEMRLNGVPGPVVSFEARYGSVVPVGDFSSGLWVVSSAPLNKVAAQTLVLATMRQELNAAIDMDQIVFTRADIFDPSCHPAILAPGPTPTDRHGYLLRLRRRCGPRGATTTAARTDDDGWTDVVRDAFVKSHLGSTIQTEVLAPEAKLLFAANDTVVSTLEERDLDLLQPVCIKVGCRIMITRNLSRTVINGSIGIVEAFARPDYTLFPQGIVSAQFTSEVISPNVYPQLPIVRLVHSGEIFQIPPVTTVVGGTAKSHFYGQEVHTLPLQLGYAFTVHKVQGLTVEGPVVIDFDDFFACPHLVYVAMSRVRRHEQLYIRGLDHEMIIVDERCAAFEGAPPTDEINDIATGDWVGREQRAAATTSNGSALLPFELCAL